MKVHPRFPPRASRALHVAGWWLWLLLAVALLAGCMLQPSADPDPAQVAQAIRARYEAALPQLPQDKQRHYAQRLYRITGDARYVPANRAHGQVLRERIGAEIRALDTPGHAQQQALELVATYPVRTERQRQRKRMLAQWGEIIYAESLAFDLVQAQSYGLLNERDLPGHARALAYLRGVDFRSFLTDADVLASYAAQVANLAWFLHELGVADLRQDVVAAFRQLYPPQRDPSLSQAEYRNKIYGMTHLVIAASNYYQRPVPAQPFAWVLDEFAAGLDQILARTKEDIYIEVGISFLLAGQAQHPAVQRLREAAIRAWDPAAGIIPAEDGGTDLVTGEHRNVLAIMLLAWPQRLHAGPLLAPPPGSAGASAHKDPVAAIMARHE